MASATKNSDENKAAPDPTDTGDGGAKVYSSDDKPLAKAEKAAKGDKGEKAEKADKGEKGEVKALDYAKPAGGPAGRGFFTIYKKGQGYWTRMGTAGGVGLLGAMLAYTLYDKIPAFFGGTDPAFGKKLGIAVAAGFLVVYGVIAWRLMNKPANVDFLIATDSEMKKVNWTSRKELIGSTKIVIVFMFLIALFLFLFDQAFGWLFYLIRVLRVSPYMGGGG